MSTISADSISTCANCGKGGEGDEDSIKLKFCAACKLVKYCSRECQAAHRLQHKKECKKRAAELHDELLFKQPQPKEDCPICMIRLPSFEKGYKYKVCCGKLICSGCIWMYYTAVASRDSNQLCPFCRTPIPETEEELIKRVMKRVELSDAQAIYELGCHYHRGTHDLSEDMNKALELWHRAGELGSVDAYHNIGFAYMNGDSVRLDRKMARHYTELAATRGDAKARYNLGFLEVQEGNWDRALKHYMIAAGSGHSASLDAIKELYMEGHATKDDYAKALRAHQAYLDEIRSTQRDEAAAFSDEFKYY